MFRGPGASKVLPSRGDAALENGHGRLSDEFGLELTRPNRVKLEKFAPCLQMPFPGWTILISPRLQLAFTFQSKHLGMSPFQCPSLFSILSFLQYEYGIWHPTEARSLATWCITPCPWIFLCIAGWCRPALKKSLRSARRNCANDFQHGKINATARAGGNLFVRLLCSPAGRGWVKLTR